MYFGIRRNKGWSLAVIAATATLLAACGSSSSSSSSSAADAASSTSAAAESASPSDSAAGEAPLKIGYIQTGPFDYYIRGVEGAQAAADQVGAEVVVFNSDNKAEKELANVEDAISQGVDGLIIFSVGKTSLEADLKKASDAGIPAVVLYGYDPSLETQAVAFIQAPTDVTGEQAGTWVAENVASGKTAVIQGLLGRGDVESYTAGFEKGVSANPSIEVVAKVAADWDRGKAQAAMADLLTAHPDLTSVFVMNEDMALGAVAAIKAAGKEGQVVVVTQNGSPPGLEAISTGELGATVAWSPAQESQMALQRLVDYIRDGTPASPVLCNTPTVVVTAENVQDAVPWIPTTESTEIGLNTPCANQ